MPRPYTTGTETMPVVHGPGAHSLFVLLQLYGGEVTGNVLKNTTIDSVAELLGSEAAGLAVVLLLKVRAPAGLCLVIAAGGRGEGEGGRMQGT